ncbi:MAG: hypothetical protein PSX81_13420 [bacterium]|nr:hypothetical protein [bacterium]
MAQTCRYLADEGHDVTLYLINEYAHFHPTADSYQPLNFKLKEYPLTKTEIVTLSRATLKSEFGQYDYLMGIEYAPAIAMRIGKPLNVFYSAATDLSHYPFSTYRYATGSTWETEERYLADLQFYGIKYAHNISMNIAPLPIENALIKIGFKGRRFEALPYLYMNLWNDKEVLKQSILKSTFDEVRNRFDLLIFHHIRHEWGEDTDEVHQKGNDKLLYALNHLKANAGTKRIGLITFEYGNSVNKSKALIHELNLEENVVWFPVNKRRDYMYGISIADVCVGQLHHNMITYTSFAEYVALKKPVIQWFNALDTERIKLPFFAVSSQEELNKTLFYICSHHNDLSILEKANESFNWLEIENVQKPLSAINNDIQIISHKSGFKSFILEFRYKLFLIIDKILFKVKLNAILNLIL